MPDKHIQHVVVAYAGEQISISLEFKKRRSLSISVHPDCSVTASAPLGCSPEEVLAHIESRRAWIANQRRYFEAFHPLPEVKRFISGETHLYLGRQYRLKVRHDRDVEVKLVGRFLNVSVPEPEEPQCVRTALDAWYRAHAEPIFRERMARCLESVPSLQKVTPTLRIRRMTKRWGSCTRRGTITLSTELIKTPLHCVEYVIMHELCHLCIHDHSPAFFRLLDRCMPDWETRKAQLDSVVLQ